MNKTAVAKLAEQIELVMASRGYNEKDLLRIAALRGALLEALLAIHPEHRKHVESIFAAVAPRIPVDPWSMNAAALILEALALDDSVRSKRKSEDAKRGADKVHNLKGGSREKRAAIVSIWLSGKYEKRDVCAEQECGALGMSFSTARKALRNIPKSAKPA